VRRLLRHRAEDRRVEWEEERARTGAEDKRARFLIEWLEIDETCPQVRGPAAQPGAFAVLWRGIEHFGLRVPSRSRQLWIAFSGRLSTGKRERDCAEPGAELRSRLGLLGEVGLAI